MRSLFLSPHSDDETLFGAFTILKHEPHVLVCFPSSGDYGKTEQRMVETKNACEHLGATASLLRYQVGLDEALKMADDFYQPGVVWAPNVGASHPDHRELAFAAHRVFKGRVLHYDTYVLESDGTPRKVRSLPPAPIDYPTWVLSKLTALTFYWSQLGHPRAYQFFLDDLREYAEQP